MASLLQQQKAYNLPFEYRQYQKTRDQAISDMTITKKKKRIFYRGQVFFRYYRNTLAANMAYAHLAFMNNYNAGADWENAKMLQNVLNGTLDLLTSDEASYEKVIKGLLNQVKNAGSELKNLSKEEIKALKIQPTMGIIGAAFSDYVQEYNKYQQYVLDENGKGKNVFPAEDINKIPTVAAAFNTYKNGQQQLAKTKGVTFEAFVKGTGDAISKLLKESVITDLQEVEDHLSEVVQTMTRSSTVSNKKLKLEGSNKRKLQITMGDDLKTNIESAQTVDVVFPAPQSAGKKAAANFNLKNYSADTRQISLLDKARIVGRIQSWEHVNMLTKNFYLSALTYYTKGPRDEFLKMGKKMFILQGLMGASKKSEGQMANYFIVNRRKGDQNNIVVVPIEAMVSYAFKNDLWEKYFLVPFDNWKEAPDAGEEGRTLEELRPLMYSVYNDVKVSVKMRQSFFSSLSKEFAKKTGVNFGYKH